MQHVNDDMDDLFKRAAENYPLKTDSADWNAVAKKLAEQDKEKPAASWKYKNLLWLLLLLPLGGVYFYMTGKNEKPVNTNSITAGENKKAITSQGNISEKTIAGKTPQASIPNANPQAGYVNTPDISSGNSLVLVNSKRLQRNSKGSIHSIITAGSSTVVPDRSSETGNQITGLTINKKTDALSETGNKVITDNKGENTINNVSIPVTSETKQDSENKIPEEKTTTAVQKNAPKQKQHGLYAGIVLSPDISTVKFQSIKKVGVSMGIVVGYQVNKRISVESGVSWDVKNYYSEGSYFNASRVYPNTNTKIKSVEGVCHMIEVPVMVKYNLTGNKTNFSISGGLSSYIMKKEDYDYIIIYNNGQPYPHSSSYKNSSTDLLAVANFAVGYNRQIKKGVALRIEPYLKVPVKGVGIGSLPIMSTGLNIGITKKLSR